MTKKGVGSNHHYPTENCNVAAAPATVWTLDNTIKKESLALLYLQKIDCIFSVFFVKLCPSSFAVRSRAKDDNDEDKVDSINFSSEEKKILGKIWSKISLAWTKVDVFAHIVKMRRKLDVCREYLRITYKITTPKCQKLFQAHCSSFHSHFNNFEDFLTLCMQKWLSPNWRMYQKSISKA